MKLKFLLPLVFLIPVQCTHSEKSQNSEEEVVDISRPNSPRIVAKKQKCSKQEREGDATRATPPSVKIGIAKPVGTNDQNSKPYLTSDYDCK